MAGQRVGRCGWAALGVALALAALGRASILLVDRGGDARAHLVWAAMLGLDVVAAAVGAAVRRRRGPGPARTFWTATAAAMLTLAVADGGSAVAALRAVGRADAVPLLQIAGGSAAYLVILAALLGRLSRQEKRTSALLAHSSDITAITGSDTRVAYVSPAATAVLGYPDGALAGRSAATLVHPADRPDAHAALSVVLGQPGATTAHQARYRHADGSWRWLEVTTTNLVDAPHVGGLISNCREVAAARKPHGAREHQATHDPLTELPNRALFGQRLAEALAASAAGAERYVAVLAVDLDDFKGINDAHGRDGGDEALIGMADLVQGCLRGSDLPARLGGDEFAVLLPRTTVGEATLVAERLLGAVRRPVLVAGQWVRLRVSIGVAAGVGKTADEVMRHADAALGRAKAAGKNQYVVHVGTALPDVA